MKYWTHVHEAPPPFWGRRPKSGPRRPPPAEKLTPNFCAAKYIKNIGAENCPGRCVCVWYLLPHCSLTAVRCWNSANREFSPLHTLAGSSLSSSHTPAGRVFQPPARFYVKPVLGLVTRLLPPGCINRREFFPVGTHSWPTLALNLRRVRTKINQQPIKSNLISFFQKK